MNNVYEYIADSEKAIGVILELLDHVDTRAERKENPVRYYYMNYGYSTQRIVKMVWNTEFFCIPSGNPFYILTILQKGTSPNSSFIQQSVAIHSSFNILGSNCSVNRHSTEESCACIEAPLYHVCL